MHYSFLALFFCSQQFRFHSEIMSLHGFHFEVKATKEDNTYSFFIEVGRHSKSMRQILQNAIPL